MKVKELIEKLIPFNDNAEILVNGKQIVNICWTSGDCDGPRNITQEKLDTTEVHLELEDTRYES